MLPRDVGSVIAKSLSNRKCKISVDGRRAPNRHGQSDTGRNFIAAAAKQIATGTDRAAAAFGLTIDAACAVDEFKWPR
jgi:hypothetical protein